MKLEKFLLYFLLFLLLVFGLSFINLTIFLELKRIESKVLYDLAYSHFVVHQHNPNYRGNKYVEINPNSEKGYRLYLFEDPIDPIRRTKVGIREGYYAANIDNLMKKLFLVEFFLILTLVLLYQTIIEGYVKKLREKEEWIKTLMLALTHRLGNFMATQKVLVSLLMKFYPQDKNLQKMEKSILKAEKDFSIFTNLIKENKNLEKEQLNIKEFILNSLNYFSEEVKNKKIYSQLKDMYVFMDKTDLEDVLYNLIGNAIKHSKSFLHIKVCPKRRMLIIRNDKSSGITSGMGIGNELTRKVLERYGHKLTVRIRKDYTVFVELSTK